MKRRGTNDWVIDEKFEVQVFLAGEAAAAEVVVAEAAAVETVLGSVGSKEHCWQ